MKIWSDLATLTTYSAAILASIGGANMAPAPRFGRSFAGAANSVGSAADTAAEIAAGGTSLRIDGAAPSSTTSRRAKRDDEFGWADAPRNVPRSAAAGRSRAPLRQQAGGERPHQNLQRSPVSSVRVTHFQPDPKAAREVSALKTKVERHLAEGRRRSSSLQVALRAAEGSAETAGTKADAALAKAVAVEVSQLDTRRQVVVNTIALAALRHASSTASLEDHAAAPGTNANASAQGTGEEVTELRRAIKAVEDRQQDLEENTDLQGEERSIVEEDIRTIRIGVREMDDQIRELQMQDNFRAREAGRFKRQIKTLESELVGIKSQFASRTDDTVNRRDDMHEINEIVDKIQLNIEMLDRNDRSLTQQIDILNEKFNRLAKAAPESEY